MHQPVLLKEILDIFDPQPGQTYIDATVNGGGHARAIAERVGERGMVLGIDWDCALIQELGVRNRELGFTNIKVACGNYANIQSIARTNHVGKVSGVLFDLGFSSYHVEASGRGFTFLKDEPLDMRYHPQGGGRTAEEIINHWSGAALQSLLREYGEERYAGRIAEGIIRARRRGRIMTTRQLVTAVLQSIPRDYLRTRRIHPATRVFQALRIAVNRELANLSGGLAGAVSFVAPGGKVAVITFHSLEDRMVKRFFREQIKAGVVALHTKKPVLPSVAEIKNNRRARSAKLRVAVKIT